eukprot:10150032-Karenia_brevis.AAC.1
MAIVITVMTVMRMMMIFRTMTMIMIMTMIIRMMTVAILAQDQNHLANMPSQGVLSSLWPGALAPVHMLFMSGTLVWCCVLWSGSLRRLHDPWAPPHRTTSLLGYCLMKQGPPMPSP